MKLSVVIPVYQAEKTIESLVERVHRNVPSIFSEIEIILVDDRSTDDSWMEIVRIAQTKTFVIGIRLSRNFGQHSAIFAGLEQSVGDWIVVMDCDLQDIPEEIPRLADRAMEGFDLVLAQRLRRKDPIMKRLTSRCYYKIFDFLTKTKLDGTVGNFGIYSRRVVDAVLKMGDSYRLFSLMVQWVGFNMSKIEVEHGYRTVGKSNYTWRKLFSLALDIVIAYSERPLRIGLKFGFIVSTLSFAIGIYYIIRFALGYIQVPGYGSIIVLLSFSTGLIITFISLSGVYIGKIYSQVKNRPIYVVDKITKYGYS